MTRTSNINKNRARRLRKETTDAEQVLWRHLRKRQIGVKFRRQQAIDRYIVDFICFEKRLIIEIDGGQHQEQVNYDNARTARLKREGYRVLRFWNNEVIHELEGVLAEIEMAL